MINNAVFTKDMAAKKLHVTREFNAPVEKVWKAWITPELLEKWWGPKPWTAVTKSMDFTVGGVWLYAMIGPEGQKHWSHVKFIAIEDGKFFAADATFCDENGNFLPTSPTGHWRNTFIGMGDRSRVEVELAFDEETDMKTLIEMGFEGGFTMGLNQLEELLAEQVSSI
jgi:uncharacterized protein YndB with AHSA1/START domain